MAKIIIIAAWRFQSIGVWDHWTMILWAGIEAIILVFW
jgi:hypothetical protein